MKKVRAFIYIRVSTLEQAKEGYSIGEQEVRLKTYAEAMGFTVTKVYTDPGYSGGNMDRPALQEMIKKINTTDVVLVYKLDRLSRSQKDTLFLIEEVFLKNDVNFISMSESFDTSTPFGRAMIGILSVFAQLEREQIRERTIMGKEARAKSGKWHGSGGEGRRVRGYNYVDGSLVINEYEAEAIKLIFDEYCKGKGIHSISSIINKKFPGIFKTDSTVFNIIRNPIYIGKIKYKGKEYQGEHEPIISASQFETAQNLIKKRTTKTNAFKKHYLLTGIMRCGHCGARMFGKSGGRLKDGSLMKYYCCYSRDGNRPHMVVDPDCKKKFERKEPLEAYVIDKIKNLNLEYEQKGLKNKEKNLEALEQKLKSINLQITRLIDLYSLGDMPIDIINTKIEKLEKEREQLKDHIEETNLDEHEKELEIQETVSQLPYFDWDNEETDAKRALISTIINKIVVYDDKIKIEWSF